MTNTTEKTDTKREQFDKLVNSYFPNLSSPQLVEIALRFEQNLK